MDKQQEQSGNDLSAEDQLLAKEWLVSILDYIIHDLVNPLGYAEQALCFLTEQNDIAKLDDEDVLDAVEDAKDGVLRTAKLLRNIKALKSGGALELSPVKVVDIFRSVGFFLKKNDCQVEYDQKDMSEITTNDFVLLAVLDNIAKNTFDHASGSTLFMSYDDGVFTLQDNGPGIPEDKLELIFSDYSSKGVGKGGLGLQIAKSFTKRLGGTINVSSVEGEGVCFTVDLRSS